MTNNKRKTLTEKGYIRDIEVSELVKNHYVGQKDYYVHTLTIENDKGELKKYQMRQLSQDHKLPIGSYVSFRYNFNTDFEYPLIEVKSFGSTYTPEELTNYNKEIKEKEK